MKMMQISIYYLKLLVLFLKNWFLAGYRTCNTYFDEPEVPKNYLKHTKNN